MSYSCTDGYSDIISALNLTTPDEWDDDGLEHVSEETDLALTEIERLQKRPALDDREYATLLAALRYWQREGAYDSSEPDSSVTNCDKTEWLTDNEIDALCERLNFGG